MSTQSAVVLRDVKKSFPLAGGTSLEVLDVEHLALPAGDAARFCAAAAARERPRC